MIKKYRKKPVVIEAKQINNKDEAQVAKFWMEHTAKCYPERQFTINDLGLIVHTIEGDMLCSYGNWLIKGLANEFYPCRNDIFQATYEEVKDDE